MKGYLDEFPGGANASAGRILYGQLTRPKPSPVPSPTPNSDSAGNAGVIRAGMSVTNSLGMKLMGVPAGTFKMGSSNGDSDETVHTVTISRGFYMGRTEVTQAEWKAVMGNNPSEFKDCDNCPVEYVSWEDTQEFIKKLNARGEGIYRLPTEAEWEYAARAGTTGDYSGNLDSMAWYQANSGDKTHPVGTKQPNAWGLYDMHGNVQEWCQDWYGDYPSGSVSDPTGASSGSNRVMRGGQLRSSAASQRSANRDNSWVSNSKTGVVVSGSPDTGFRVVRQIGNLTAVPETSGPTEDIKIYSKPLPVYTEAARNNQVQGIVTLRVTFLANGSIGSVSPVNSLPDGLTEQAIAVARKIKFEPARKNGVPYEVTKHIQYNFTLW